MVMQQTTTKVPLRTDADGAVRVGESRVLLEMVIRAFNRGKTPESIVESYPVLHLDEVYAVIAYYMQNQDEVDQYLREVEAAGERIRREIEAQQPESAALRERILRRLKEKRQSS